MTLLRWALVLLGTIAVIVTLLPLVRSNESLIRVWDFPRIQVAVILLAVLIASAFVLPIGKWTTWAFLAALAGALAWQVSRILPYTPLVATQAKAIEKCEANSRLSLLVSNVLIENRNAAMLLSLVDRMAPDLVLLVETDNWWDKQLEPLAAAYPHAIRLPREDGHGMHLFSRFALIDPQVRFLVEDDIPSVKTGLALPSGQRVDLYGLHPNPPLVEDTEERDAELLLVGAEIRKEEAPAIVAGDLNDVAWSRTSNLFRAISGLLDPRIGRGPFATFNAKWPLVKWPLDHVFFEGSFRLLKIAVMPSIGSDHFPLFVALCHDASASAAQEKPEPEASDLEAAEEAIEEGREDDRD